MSQSRLNGFFDNPETDDTLQNIRREYLASKKNLQELLVTSPTQIRTRSFQQQAPTPPNNDLRELQSDERLRQQLREGFKKDTSFHNSVRAPVIPNIPQQQEIDSLRSVLHSQQRQIDQLVRGLDSQAARNSALHQRVTTLERYVSELESRLSYNRPEVSRIPERNPRVVRKPYDAAIEDHDNTRVLLNLNTNGGPERQISNLDDSTTKLIQLAQDPGHW